MRSRLLGPGGQRVPEAEQEQPPAAERPEPPATPNRRGKTFLLPDLSKASAEQKRRWHAEGMRRRGGGP